MVAAHGAGKGTQLTVRRGIAQNHFKTVCLSFVSLPDELSAGSFDEKVYFLFH